MKKGWIREDPEFQLQQDEVNLLELPEDIITKVISFTSPQASCMSACVSSRFRSAADSDVVWENFVSPDWIFILSRAVPPLSFTYFSSKKDLYLHLCNNPILLDGGTKSISLDNKTGKKCITLGARGLEIRWGDSPKYWRWRPDDGSRFGEVAELIDVCWVEMIGYIETRLLSRKTRYGVYLVMKYANELKGIDDPPAEIWVKFVEGGDTASGFRSVYLELNDEGLRRDGWMEIELGEFYNNQGEEGQIKVYLFKRSPWKRGLTIEGVQFRPFICSDEYNDI